MNRQIILASQSPRRIQLLKQIGIDATVCPSHIVEKISSNMPEEIVLELSFQKAADVACRLTRDAHGLALEIGAGCDTPQTDIGYSALQNTQPVIIGADTIVSIDGLVLGKPSTHEDAYSMICLLSGKTHQVHTGVSLISGKNRLSFVEKTDVEVWKMDEHEIRAYAYSEEPMDKAGAYGIQGSFAKYIRAIQGDYFNVVGLPVARLYHMLKELEGMP